MAERGGTWAVVLAAGDGTRLAGVTARNGVAIPKQYCALVESRTLLRATLDRMRRLVPRERIVVVVAEGHRRHWERELADWPAENVVSQPENRGTAAGLLLPLFALLRRDPCAQVVVTPADHHFEDESALVGAVSDALRSLPVLAERLILLGIEPDRAESGYGWIVPGRCSRGAPMGVERFVEKPEPGEAAALLAAGALWNSFVIVARLASLLDLYGARAPELLNGMRRALDPDRPLSEANASLRALYGRLEPRDFSRHLLSGAEERLALQPIPACGWTDLGTPDRLAAVRAAARRRPARRARSTYSLPTPPGSYARPATL